MVVTVDLLASVVIGSDTIVGVLSKLIVVGAVDFVFGVKTLGCALFVELSDFIVLVNGTLINVLFVFVVGVSCNSRRSRRSSVKGE